MRLFHVMLLLIGLTAPCFIGCSSNEPESPTVDELSEFLNDNPDIAAEEENMGDIGDE